MTATYLASTLNLSWKAIKSYGIDPVDLFRTAGIDMDRVACAGCRINYRSVDKLWAVKTRLIKDPCLGLRMAEYWHPSYLNALGYSWLASSTRSSELQMATGSCRNRKIWLSLSLSPLRRSCRSLMRRKARILE